MTQREKNKATDAKVHAKPGRKRMGKDAFVPVTMKVESSELSTIEMIAKASRRSRSDVMREMVSLGMERMPETAFAPKDEAEPGDTDVVVELAADARPDDVSAQRSAVESLLPIASAGTATRAQWAELAWRSAAVLCAAATGDAGDPPEGSLQALSTLAPERSAEGVPSPLQTTLGFSDDEANAIGRASRLVLKSGLLEGEASSVDAEAAVRDAVMAIAETATGPKDSGIPAPDEAGGEQAAAVPEESNNGANPQQAEALAQRGASEIVDYVSRHPRANTGELLAATGVSSSALRRRIAALEEAGALANDGTATRPIWHVPGVEHAPEDMLTATQAAVLGLMRREPPTPTGKISSCCVPTGC